MAIIVKDMHKTHRGVHTLRGANLTVRDGEFCVLLGSDTPGKAMLLACLAGVAHPDMGTLTMNGRLMTRWQERSGIGAVLKSDLFDDSLTLARNLLFAARLRRVKGDRRGAMEDICSRLQLTNYMHTPVGYLSLGLRRRANLARALIHRPHYLILDEPTAGIDPASAELIWQMVIHELRKGTSVLLSTSSTSLAHRAHTIAVVEEGLVVARGKPASLMEKFSQVSLGDLLQVLSHKTMTSELKGRYTDEQVMTSHPFTLEDFSPHSIRDAGSAPWDADEVLDEEIDVGIGIMGPSSISPDEVYLGDDDDELEPLDEILGLWEDDTLEVWEGLSDLYQPLDSYRTEPVLRPVPTRTTTPSLSPSTPHRPVTPSKPGLAGSSPSPSVLHQTLPPSQPATPAVPVAPARSAPTHEAPPIPKVLPARLPPVLSTSLASASQEGKEQVDVPPTTASRLPPGLAESLASAARRKKGTDVESKPTSGLPPKLAATLAAATKKEEPETSPGAETTEESSDLGLPEALRSTPRPAGSGKTKGLTLNLEGLAKPTPHVSPAPPREESDTPPGDEALEVVDPTGGEEKKKTPGKSGNDALPASGETTTEDQADLGDEDSAGDQPVDPDGEPTGADEETEGGLTSAGEFLRSVAEQLEKEQLSAQETTREPLVEDVLKGFPPLVSADDIPIPDVPSILKDPSRLAQSLNVPKLVLSSQKPADEPDQDTDLDPDGEERNPEPKDHRENINENHHAHQTPSHSRGEPDRLHHPPRRTPRFSGDDEFSQLVERHYREDSDSREISPEHRKEVLDGFHDTGDTPGPLPSFDEKFPVGMLSSSPKKDGHQPRSRYADFDDQDLDQEDQQRQDRVHQAVVKRLEGARKRLSDKEDTDE